MSTATPPAPVASSDTAHIDQVQARIDFLESVVTPEQFKAMRETFADKPVGGRKCRVVFFHPSWPGACREASFLAAQIMFAGVKVRGADAAQRDADISRLAELLSLEVMDPTWDKDALKAAIAAAKLSSETRHPGTQPAKALTLRSELEALVGPLVLLPEGPARDAARLAAQIAFGNENPGGEFVVERDGMIAELKKLIGFVDGADSFFEGEAKEAAVIAAGLTVSAADGGPSGDKAVEMRKRLAALVGKFQPFAVPPCPLPATDVEKALEDLRFLLTNSSRPMDPATIAFIQWAKAAASAP